MVNIFIGVLHYEKEISGLFLSCAYISKSVFDPPTIFCAYLAYQTNAAFLYIVAGITALITICVILALSSSVTFNQDGILVRSGIKQKYFMHWNSILCCGIFSIRIMGASQTQRYIFFSTKPVCVKEIEQSQILPKETENFIFLSYTRDVFETASMLWNSEKLNLIR